MSLFFNVAGGLAIFIYGMMLMSDGLNKAAGERMRSLLKLFSSNRFVAVLSGTVVTAVIQSSSASTVMVIGFLNAGLLTLIQAIGIIFGANIGTTITAQLVAFRIDWIIMPAVILGLLLHFFKKESLRGWGETIIGFGFLFLGMQLMSSELKVLSQHPAFIQAFQSFDCRPVNGLIPFGALMGAIGVGLGTTLLIQSSSACTGIIIALGAGGVIDLYTALALVLGTNIGTTVTAQLAALAANRIAKQAALAHTLFNVCGVVLVVISFYIPFGTGNTPLFFKAVQMFSPDGDLPRCIANAHTLFNVLTTLVLLPFVPALARLCEKIIPVGPGKVKYQRLDPLLLHTPDIALSQTCEVLRRMVRKSSGMIDRALHSREKNGGPSRELVKELAAQENRVDEVQHDIMEYLSQLMRHELSESQATTIPLLIHCTNDAERIGDHTATILDLIERFSAGGVKLSTEAQNELSSLHDLLMKQAKNAESILEKFTREKYKKGAEYQETLLELTAQCEKDHLKRLKTGKCLPLSAVFYIEILSEIRKVSRHLANITERSEAFVQR